MKARTGMRWVLVTATVAVLAAGCSEGRTRVVVGAGTTLVDGGLLEAVVAEYQAAHPGVRLSVVGAPTARVLALAEAGSADVTITHDPIRERRFMADRRAAQAAEVFASRFMLAGPPDQAGTLEGFSPAQAFGEIARKMLPFVSRADGSGTHQKERRIWERAEVDPTGREWYVQTRQGMGITLQVASQRQAFVLVEWSVFLAAGEATDLVEVPLQPIGLENPYRAMAVADSPVREEAVEFVDWLWSTQGQEAVRRANQDLYGREVFHPTGELPG